MMNPALLFKLKSSWDRFSNNHPKLMPFFGAINRKGVAEGTIIEISVTTPEGETIATNVKISKDDLELFEEIKQLSK